MRSLSSLLAAVADATPGRIAIVDGARRIAYGELWQQIGALAADLLSRGLQPGERVALLLPNRIEAAVAVYGTWLAGGVAVPLNVQARTRDYVPWLRHCEARFVLHERQHVDAQQALVEFPAAQAIVLDDAQPIPVSDASLPGPQSAFAGDDAAPALILYTSGTTGAPKGVALSHANLLANARSVVGYLGLQADDSVLSVLPFYYAYGASVLHTHLMRGARVVLAPNLLFPQQIVDAMAQEQVTGFSGVPSTFALLLDRVPLAQHPLPALRYLTQAGGAMSPALTQRLRAALPAPQLYVMYGQTEATSRLTWLPPAKLQEKLGSAGIPVDGVELQIRHEDGSIAPVTEEGDVWVRGPNVMLGYWNDPETTASVLRDGWLRTGDLGRVDDEGYLFLAGRRSDMIKTGAHRVHPNDVEEAIAELDGVQEVAVAGIDDAVLGQVVKAFVVRSAGAALDDNRIKAHCRARLAPYKIPKFIEFVDALPRTASGKVRRVQLTQVQANA
jgi:long-chain acyl-CoA synthetase